MAPRPRFDHGCAAYESKSRSLDSAEERFARDDTALLYPTWARALEGALVAEDVDGGVPYDVDAAEAVGGPLIGFVEALGAEVVDKSEEVGVLQAK